MTGSSGCNSLFATYTRTGNALKFTNIGGTMMACPEPLMKQEKTFTDALKASTTYRITGQVLDLLAGTKILARFPTASICDEVVCVLECRGNPVIRQTSGKRYNTL